MFQYTHDSAVQVNEAEDDYRCSLAQLGAACQGHHCAVHAYVRMTNHVHLRITPHDEPSIGKVMPRVGRAYVRSFHETMHRTGTCWEGRYRVERKFCYGSFQFWRGLKPSMRCAFSVLITLALPLRSPRIST